MKRSALLFLPGFLFGAGLAISGMTNPAKVIGFLDIAGDWDPSLALVMLGAILAFGTLNVIVQRGQKPLLWGSYPGIRGARAIDARLILGASIFGVGWALAGFCPGPALTNLVRLRPDITGFVAAMTAGMLIARLVFGVDRD